MNQTTQQVAEGVSAEQVRFFRTFGYLVLKGFFSPADMATINEETDRAFDEQYAEPFDGKARRDVYMVDQSTPFCTGLLENPRCLTIAQQLADRDLLGHVTHVAQFVGDSDWHRDTNTSFQGGLGFRCYLEPVDADSGALRVIAVSHQIPRNYEEDDALWAGVVPLAIDQVPAAVLATEPGDAIVIDIGLWHGSCGGDAGRRMLSITYFNNPTSARECEFLCEQGVSAGQGQGKSRSRRDYVFSRAWLANTVADADRQRWIDRLREVGYFDAPGLVES